MKTLEKILVCTDFSQDSQNAFLAAKKLQQKLGSKIYLLHVSEIQVEWDWLLTGSQGEESHFLRNRDFKNFLQRKMDDFHQNHLDDTETVILEGIPFQKIYEFILENDINYVFVGKRGKGQRWFPVGSLTQKIVSSSSIPVFVIKHDFSPVRIAGLVDPSGPGHKIVEMTEEMSYLFDTQAEIISVYKNMFARNVGMAPFRISLNQLDFSSDEKEKIQNDLTEYIKKFLSPNSKVKINILFSEEKKISYFLNFYLQKNKTDLIVLQRHQKGMLDKIFIGEESRRLLEIFEGNMLFLPP